jgi:hypothetical protein
VANCCSYKVIVKGKKNACYAFFGSMPCMDGKQISREFGTDENYTVKFNGGCKWSVDAYCTPWQGNFPVKLPEDAKEACNEAWEKYRDKSVQERSKMFEVEVMCNSADIDDYDPEFGLGELYEHYINGEDVGGECPDDLVIEFIDDEALIFGL